MNTLMARLMTVTMMLVAVLGFGLPAFAQQYTGRIEVTVFDATGAVLPGAVVELTGPLNQTAVTDARGEARFLNLTVGTYQVHATLQGFTEYRNTNVPVAAGVAVPLQVKLAVAGGQETIFVTAQSPVIDTKKQGTATNVGLDELQNIPTSRDPWVVMQTVPGIVMDRVNVGGSESGQQSNYMTKGATGADTTWNIDGMPITDMSSLSSPFYFDFDAFQEMSVTTGGADAKSATGGVQMNMMLKSGTNNYHGNVKGYFENEGLQWTNMDPALAASLGSKTGSGDRTDQFTDWGGDIGGPILKDRWWAWGAYGKQDIRIIKTAGAHDRTVLENASIKTQAQFTKSLRGSFTFFQANKLKWGRGAGAFNTQPATYDQSGAGGPNQFFKGEANYVFGNNLFLVGRYAHVRGGFQLIPEGGSSTPAWVDAASVWQDSIDTYITTRPQDTVNFDANYFKGAHEIKVGFAWRKASVHSTDTWGGDYYTQNDRADAVLTGNGEYPYLFVNVNAPYATDVSAKYYNFYVGDTITLSRMTINLGLRYDRQVASVLPTEMAAPADPFLASKLPAVTAPGVSNALTFGIVEPRVGFTYAVDEGRKTQLRATYAMFTSQAGAGIASFLSVAQYRGFYMDAYDANGDHIAQPSEFIQASYAAHIANGDYWGFDPTNPTAAATSIHKVGDYGTPRTHEIILGVDHELMPNFGVSASFTWRRMMDFNWRPVMSSNSPNGYMDGSDYTLQGTITGTLPTGIPGSPEGSYSVPYYAPTPGIVWDPAKGTIYSKQQDYHQSYKGFEMTATKRMSNRWMARLGFSTNSWREYFGPTGQGDPTPKMGSTWATPNVNGGVVVYVTSGSGKSSIYMTQPKYQIMANGMYQLPHNIDVGASYSIRQGYPMPWNYNTSGGFKDPLNGASKRLILPSEFDYARLSGAGALDVRVGYALHAQKATFNFDFDLFNLFNSSTVLGRQYTKNSTAYTNIAEILQPRIARIGLRINF